MSPIETTTTAATTTTLSTIGQSRAATMSSNVTTTTTDSLCYRRMHAGGGYLPHADVVATMMSVSGAGVDGRSFTYLTPNLLNTLNGTHNTDNCSILCIQEPLSVGESWCAEVPPEAVLRIVEHWKKTSPDGLFGVVGTIDGSLGGSGTEVPMRTGRLTVMPDLEVRPDGLGFGTQYGRGEWGLDVASMAGVAMMFTSAYVGSKLHGRARRARKREIEVEDEEKGEELESLVPSKDEDVDVEMGKFS